MSDLLKGRRVFRGIVDLVWNWTGGYFFARRNSGLRSGMQSILGAGEIPFGLISCGSNFHPLHSSLLSNIQMLTSFYRALLLHV